MRFRSTRGYLDRVPDQRGNGFAGVHHGPLARPGYGGANSAGDGGGGQVGLVVRGLYGEGSEAVGNIFQLSNQVTLGRTEEEIVASPGIGHPAGDRHRSGQARELILSRDRIAWKTGSTGRTGFSPTRGS